MYRAGPTGDSTDVVEVLDALGSVGQATVTVGPGIAVAPASAAVAPRQRVGFDASGGSGTGYVWQLVWNASGASLDPGTGSYEAGPNGPTVDYLQVTDSLGNVATALVEVGAPVRVSPEFTWAVPRQPVAFTAGGGLAPYAWRISANGSGGLIDPSSGLYVAGPSGAVTDTIEVADALGSVAVAQVAVGDALAIIPASADVAPREQLGFMVQGGAGPYAWSLAASPSGGTVDPGSGFYAAGPVGLTTDVVRVEDAFGAVVTAAVRVGPGLSIAPAAATVPPLGQRSFAASGGLPPYAFELVSSGSGGWIDWYTGIYTAGLTGNTVDTVRVTDAVGNEASALVQVSQGVSITPAGATVSPLEEIAFTSTGGVAPYTWLLLANGSLGTIDEASGLYRAGSNGDATDLVQATDSLGNQAIATVTGSSNEVMLPLMRMTASPCRISSIPSR
jgi:hypothetical protein